MLPTGFASEGQASMIVGGCPVGGDSASVERGKASSVYYHDYLQLDKILGAQKV